MAAKGGDSKNGLIISLVIAILLVIGLGVSTYFGYAEQEDLRKKEKDARTAENSAKKNRDWYRFLALQGKAYLGAASKADLNDLGPLRGQYERGDFKGEPNFAENENAVKRLDDATKGGYGWNLGEARPANTAADKIQSLENAIVDLRKKLDTAQAETDQAKKAKAQAEDVAQAAADGYKKSLEALNQKFVELTKQRQTAFESTQEELEKTRARVEEAEKKGQASMDELQKKLQIQEVEKKEFENLYNRSLREKTDLAKELSRVRGQIDPVNPLESGPPRGKIVRLDRSSTLAWINLGSADNVKPQVRFSIFKDKGNGTATGELKGSLQVTEVVGEHMAKAQVTYTRNANRDPILGGDLLYNPTWSPEIREHVAVAGMIDLTGLGTDNTQDFIRSLERQGIIVDAHLDLKDVAVKGKGMGLQTTYLILGEKPELGLQGVVGEAGKNEHVRVVNEKISQMRDEAIKLGIQIVPYRRYLVLTGVRTPRGVSEAAPLGTRYTPPDKKEREPKEKEAPKKEPAKADGKPKDNGK